MNLIIVLHTFILFRFILLDVVRSNLFLGQNRNIHQTFDGEDFLHCPLVTFVIVWCVAIFFFYFCSSFLVIRNTYAYSYSSSSSSFTVCILHFVSSFNVINLCNFVSLKRKNISRPIISIEFESLCLKFGGVDRVEAGEEKLPRGRNEYEASFYHRLLHWRIRRHVFP